MCTRPQLAYQEAGQKPVLFQKSGKNYKEIILPCGQCPECNQDYYTDWATRGSRELYRWETSLFITLTYNEEHLPHDKSLDKIAIRNFIKRVKKKFNSTQSNPIRQIYCGEYGTKTGRPHYHIILFNCDFADKKIWRTTDQGHPVFTSETLNKLWSIKGQEIGHAEFGFATPATISYLFKYILKKKSKREKQQPLIVNGNPVQHEFIQASRNPGIGSETRQSRSIRNGFLTVNGVKKRLPTYYKRYLKEHDPESYERLQERNQLHRQSKKPETRLRLEQKENAQKLLTDTKKRL